MSLLTKRDLDILNFIAKFGYCLERHLAIFCNLSLMQVTRVVNRLQDMGYLNKQKILVNVGHYLQLTKDGAKLLEVKAVNKINLNTLNHDTLLVDLYFYLLQQQDVLSIKTDKEIRREIGIFKENEQIRVPDLLINDNISIELELSEKPKFRLQEIVNTYIVDDNIEQICYFLTDRALLKKIHALTWNSPKFKFYLFEFNSDNNTFTSIRCYQNEDFIAIKENEFTDIPVKAVKRFGNFEFN